MIFTQEQVGLDKLNPEHEYIAVSPNWEILCSGELIQEIQEKLSLLNYQGEYKVFCRVMGG